MRYWSFKNYVDSRGNNAIHAWLNGLPKPAKAKLNAVIYRLELTQHLWESDTKMLVGNECDGLMEIRVLKDKIQLRPLCFYGPSRGDVTILIGAIERNNRLDPPSACSTAQRRRAEVSDGGKICDHDFS